jgi:hypothetical protein
VLELKRRNSGTVKKQHKHFLLGKFNCRFLNYSLFHFIIYVLIRCVKNSFNDIVDFIHTPDFLKQGPAIVFYSYNGILNLQIYVLVQTQIQLMTLNKRNENLDQDITSQKLRIYISWYIWPVFV